MNWIDLITALALLVAVWNGWRQGFVVQACGLAGLFAAIWCAVHWGAAVGARLGLDAEVAAPGGFVAVLVVVLAGVAVLSRLIRKLFRIVGFGVADILLGIAVAAVKTLLLLCLLFSAFDRLNEDYVLVGPQTVESSVTYRPVLRAADALFPFLAWAGEQVSAAREPQND